MAVDAGAADGAVSEDESAADSDAAGDATLADDESTQLGESSDVVTSPLRLAALSGMLIVVALVGLASYLGVRSYQMHQGNQQRNHLLEAGRQSAVNLTTIDWEHADADVQRILASATGSFYDDFAQRSQPFVDVVKQTQSKSVGTVTEAGFESFSGNEAQILVSVAVTTTNPGAPEQSPRNWRMRMSVQKAGDGAKVSNVEFVP